MFIQPVTVFVINPYFLSLNMVALRVVVERKIPMIQQLLWIGTVPGRHEKKNHVRLRTLTLTKTPNRILFNSRKTF